MKIRVSKELLKKALQSNENLNYVEFECEYDDVCRLDDDEIDALVDEFYHHHDIQDFINLMSDNEIIKLIKDLKEQIGGYYNDFDLMIELIDDKFDDEQKQALIKKLVELNPSVEQAQRLVKTIKAHNESTRKDEQC